MIYEPRICDICEEWGCKADEYRQTMQLSTEAVGPEHKAFWPAMRCAFKASNLKATYKARAEAAEGKIAKAIEIATKQSQLLWDAECDEDLAWKEGQSDAGQEILEALNGKLEPFDANDLPF